MAAEESGGGEARYAACLQCTQLCHQTHGRGLPSSRIPSFYSVLPSSSPCAYLSLPIPPAFLGGRGVRIDDESAPSELLHSEVELEGPSGEIWTVALQGRTLSNLSFTKGWEKFVTDHGLSDGDLLVFKLLSRGFFSVTIFGKDGCGKEEAFAVQNSGARLIGNANGSKKRPAEVEVFDCENVDVIKKRRKVGCNKQIAPLVIDIEDDEDDLIVLSEAKSGNANRSTRVNSDDDISRCEPSKNNISAQEEHAGKVESTCKPQAAQHVPPSEQVTGCSMDAKEDTHSHLNLVELPPTPSHADKSNLPIIAQRELHLQVNCSNAKCSSVEEESEESDDQESSSTDQSDKEDCCNHRDYVKHAEKSFQENKDAIESCPLDEYLQHDQLKAFLAKDYMAAAFISKRRPISAEEREKALLAAKRFKSNRPHFRKLMKESHVYRGFWMSLPAGFSSEHLPSEIQGATLLDGSGKAWSAKWLGSRSGLSGGWRRFSLDHGLEEGDVCVFELMDKNRIVIKVHIFRVVKLKNELPGRDHYFHKPQARQLIGCMSRKSSSAMIAYNSRKSSCPVKKMRGAIVSMNTCNVAEDTACLHTPPNSTEPKLENWRLNNFGKQVKRQLDPLFKRSENRLLQSASKVAITTKEDRDDSKAKAKASKKYYTVERLYNRRKGIVEEEFLVKLEGKPEASMSSLTRVKRDGRAWWVPISHFTKDKSACHL